MLNLSKNYLFRLTHIEKYVRYFQYGITHILSANANIEYKAIGDSSLISNRNAFVLPNGKTLGQYIPFYFGVRMPMLYVIQKGYNGVHIINPENIVYCISSVEQIIKHKLPFIFTNGHAVDGLTEFFDTHDISNIGNIIDTKAIKAKYWRDDNDLDLKRRKEAEFLIESDIPPSAISGWVVYNEKAKAVLIEIGIAVSTIIIKPDYYF